MSAPGSTHSQTRQDPPPAHHSHEEIDLQRLTGTETNVALREDIAPDGGYGWICTACVFLINAHTWGVNAAWGVFLAYFRSRETFVRATQLQYALIGGLSISQALIISPLVGTFNERLGTRLTLLIGTILISCSLLASSFATQVWHLFLAQGACFGYGMGMMYITASAVLPQWFQRRRSLALGIASSGAGVGGLAYNLGVGAGLDSIGWRMTYRVLAISTLLINLACTILLKDRNKFVLPTSRSFNLREFDHVETWLITFWGVLTELGYITLLYSLPSFALSIGLNSQQGSITGAALNLGLALGRPGIGWASDRWGRINVATVCTALCGTFVLALWVPAQSFPLLLVFAVASGAVTGTFWSCVVPVTAEVVGIRRLPSVFGMICLPLVIPTTFAEPIALQLVSAKGYLSSQVFVGCMFLGGAASVWFLRSWKIADEEKRTSPGGVVPCLWLTIHGLITIKKV